MSSRDAVQWGVVVVVCLTVVVGGLVPGVGGTQPELGDGTASVTDVAVAVDDLAVDRGRFGTGVFYLRVPDATVHVTDHERTPRLVYRVQVPALDVEATTTELVTRTGRHALAGRDQGLDPGGVDAEAYDAVVELRVQSFAADETVYRENATVEVRR